MSRNLRESLVGGRNFPAGSQQHRRGQSLVTLSKDSDENLDLFSRNRRTTSLTSSDESSDVSVKLGRLSVGSTKLAKTGLDDLLAATDGGKHDYDWLLTPPGTPLGSETRATPAAARSSSLVRSASTTKTTSRLSVSHSESNHSSRPSRSSSVTRPSISTSQYTSYSSNRNSSILNTSSSSVSSYIRPSSPITRSPSSGRPSTPSSRPNLSRPSTPSKARPISSSSSVDRTRPSQNSRPSTPNSRSHIPANSNPPVVRTNSRPSTPTRRHSMPSLSGTSGLTSSVSRALSNGLPNRQTSTPASRPSSPSPRVRVPHQPIVLPDFSLDTPPNLRTTLPDRPVSAGRSRPGTAVAARGSPEITTPLMPRRNPSPIVTRGRVTEPLGRARVNASVHTSSGPESRRISAASDSANRMPVKSSSTTINDSNGFGRSISKKSLDMAIRHMDIRSGTGSMRTLSGTTLFPQSIRSATSKVQSRATSGADYINSNGNLQNGDMSENGSNFTRLVENGNRAIDGRYPAKVNKMDIYESSRYDSLLLKEDTKNTNWLHSFDDKSDPGLVFDNGFGSLPEPFSPL